MELRCKKCGSLNLETEAKGNQTGIYCCDCGKWVKWATKEEIRVITHHEIPVKNTDSDLREKINKAIEEITENMYCDKNTRLVKNANASGLQIAVDILKKHIEGEVEE